MSDRKRKPDFAFSAEDIEIHRDPLIGVEVTVYDSSFGRNELDRLLSVHWDSVVKILRDDFGALYELAEPLMHDDESNHFDEQTLKNNWNDWHKEVKP